MQSIAREDVVSKKYVLKLSGAERQVLSKVISQRKPARWKLQRAFALLHADAGPQGPAWPDSRIAEAYGMTTRSLESWRKRAVEEGPLSLLERKPEDSTRHRRKLDGEQEARLVTLACSEPPLGYARWTLRLLAQRMVELEIVESVSHEAVRTTLKKTRLSRG
jgi:hypothetical protein